VDNVKRRSSQFPSVCGIYADDPSHSYGSNSFNCYSVNSTCVFFYNGGLLIACDCVAILSGFIGFLLREFLESLGFLTALPNLFFPLVKFVFFLLDFLFPSVKIFLRPSGFLRRYSSRVQIFLRLLPFLRYFLSLLGNLLPFLGYLRFLLSGRVAFSLRAPFGFIRFTFFQINHILTLGNALIVLLAHFFDDPAVGNG